MKNYHRLIALSLAVAICAGITPTSIFANEVEDVESNTINTDEVLYESESEMQEDHEEFLYDEMDLPVEENEAVECNDNGVTDVDNQEEVNLISELAEAEETYHVTIMKSENGSISFSDNMSLPEREYNSNPEIDDYRSFSANTEIYLNVIPNEGYELEYVKLDFVDQDKVDYFNGDEPEFKFVMPKGNMVISAGFTKIVPRVTVTYDPGEKSFLPFDENVTFAYEIDEDGKIRDQERMGQYICPYYKLLDTTRSYYVVGWRIQGDATETFYKNNSSSVLVPEEGIIFEAVWASVVTVTYDANGGFFMIGENDNRETVTEYTHTGTIAIGGGDVVYQEILCYAAHMLVGWKVKGANDDKIYKSFSEYRVKEDTTFVAQWEESPYDNLSNAEISGVSDQIYTGSELTPSPTVAIYGRVLTEGVDYTVSYKNNIDIGSATMEIIGILLPNSWYGKIGTKEVEFSIVPPAPVLSDVRSTDIGMEITWSKVESAEGYYVYRAIGNDSAELIKTITDNATLTYVDTVAAANNTKYTYYVVAYKQVGDNIYKSANSEKIEAPLENVITVSYDANGGTFVLDATEQQEIIKEYTYKQSDYRVAQEDYDYANMITRQGYYFTGWKVNGTDDDRVYGSDSFNEFDLKEDTTFVAQWEIDPNKNLSVAEISGVLDQIYTGSELIQSPTVVLNGDVLNEGEDYTISYKNNIEAGTATMEITGVHGLGYGYGGCKELSFNISPKTITPTVTIETGKYIYDGTVKKPSVTVKDGDTVLMSETDYKVAYSNNRRVGKASVKVTLQGNYTGTKTVNFTIVPPAPKLSSVTNTAKGVKVTWTKVDSAEGYYVYRSIGSRKAVLVKTITSGSTLTYTDSAAKTNGTKYTYYIVAYKTVGNVKYKSANSSKKISYYVSRPAIASLTNSAAGKMTVKWGKNTKATGYQIKYVTGTTTKTVKVTSYKTVSKVISNLVKGKTYKVYVRCYRTVSGKTYYSAWSAAKSVKIAK